MSDQIKVEIDFNEDTADKFPVYCMYGGQCQPQPAYIKVDIRNGRVWPDYNGNSGGGCSPDEFHGLVQRFDIPADIHKSELSQLLKDNVDFFQKVVDLFVEVWNGSNYVARAKEGIDSEIHIDLDHEWDSQIVHDVESFGIIDVMQEFANNTPTNDIEKFITDWFDCDGENGWFEQDSAEYLVEYIANNLDVSDCEGNPELAKFVLERRETCMDDWEITELNQFIDKQL
jgi:hypothetical protein